MPLNICRVILFFLSLSLFGQSNIYYPASFNAYYLNPSQVSPAFIPEKGKLEITSGYKSLTGAFRKISSYQFTAGRIFRKNTNAHLGRLQFFNEKEGSYISNPRGYVNYAYLISLNDNLELFSGLNLGFTGMYISAPNTTQSSFTMPDGAIGIGLRSNWIEVGASSMQIFNYTFTPVQNPVILKRYYNFYTSLKKEWASEWYLRFYGLNRVLPSSDPDVILTGAFGFRNNLEAGIAFKYKGGLSVFGIFGTGIGEDRLKLLINYNSPLFGLVPKYQSNIELGLSYLVFGGSE